MLALVLLLVLALALLQLLLQLLLLLLLLVHYHVEKRPCVLPRQAQDKRTTEPSSTTTQNDCFVCLFSCSASYRKQVREVVKAGTDRVAQVRKEAHVCTD